MPLSLDLAIIILSLSISLPALAMAMWHGWKFEQHRADCNVEIEEDA